MESHDFFRLTRRLGLRQPKRDLLQRSRERVVVRDHRNVTLPAGTIFTLIDNTRQHRLPAPSLIWLTARS